MNAGLPPDAGTPYAVRFAEVIGAKSPGWLTSARQSAFDAFVAQGWPTKKQEDWRFTDITPITESDLLPALAAQPSFDLSHFDPSLLKLGGNEGHRLVFVDGHHHREFGTGTLAGWHVGPLSSPAAMDSAELRAHLGRHLSNANAFVALNTAFMSDGAFIHIPAGFRAELPIYLVYLASAADSTSFPRTVIVAGANSEATVVEIHLGAHGRATLSNAATEIVLGSDAQLAYHAIQKTSPIGFHMGHVAITQAAGSTFSAHSLALDGRIVRNDLHVVLAGEGCTCNLDGVYLATGKSLVDNQTTIDHSKPRSTSRESYRGVVDGAGHAVFSGRIVVRPGAEKTDAQQSNRNLLLSDQAQVNSKPQLEIFTSDVKCSHGATTGRLDPDALFYLRARGIGEKEASRILIRAFLQQGLERIGSARIRADLEAVLDRRITEMAPLERGPNLPARGRAEPPSAAPHATQGEPRS
jgi:Fe-S cluster assembly protein SufD